MRRTILVALALFAVTLVSRLPFAADTLWAHDSALYAAALERGFHVDADLLDQRPHPPGYILYVAMAALARLAGLGSNDALATVSIVASALAAAALYLLARRRLPERVAVLLAVAYAANPLVWQYSDVAYPYALLGLLSILTAALFGSVRGRGLGPALAASAAFALFVGARQDLALLAAPLWLWMVWPLGIRRASAAAAASLATALVWLVPTVVLSGGPSEYAAALASQGAYVGGSYSVTSHGLMALVANAATTAFALEWGTLVVAPFAAAAAIVLGLRAARLRRLDADDALLVLWVLPALVVYLTLHIGEWGYILSVVPGLYVIAGRAIAPFVAPGALVRARTGLAWAGLAVAPAILFVAGSAPFSAQAIATHDRELGARVAFVRTHYAPRSTLIITREDYLLVRYYLPDYRTRQYDPEPFSGGGRRMRARTIDTVVVFTRGLVADSAIEVRRVSCGGGAELVQLNVGPDAVLEFRGERYTVRAEAP